jgi:hypothetical protein
LAALLELFHRGVQRNQTRNAAGRAIAAPKDLPERPGLAHSLDEKFVDR